MEIKDIVKSKEMALTIAENALILVKSELSEFSHIQISNVLLLLESKADDTFMPIEKDIKGLSYLARESLIILKDKAIPFSSSDCCDVLFKILFKKVPPTKTNSNIWVKIDIFIGVVALIIQVVALFL